LCESKLDLTFYVLARVLWTSLRLSNFNLF